MLTLPRLYGLFQWQMTDWTVQVFVHWIHKLIIVSTKWCNFSSFSHILYEKAVFPDTSSSYTVGKDIQWAVNHATQWVRSLIHCTHIFCLPTIRLMPCVTNVSHTLWLSRNPLGFSGVCLINTGVDLWTQVCSIKSMRRKFNYLIYSDKCYSYVIWENNLLQLEKSFSQDWFLQVSPVRARRRKGCNNVCTPQIDALYQSRQMLAQGPTRLIKYSQTQYNRTYLNKVMTRAEQDWGLLSSYPLLYGANLK